MDIEYRFLLGEPAKNKLKNDKEIISTLLLPVIMSIEHIETIFSRSFGDFNNRMMCFKQVIGIPYHSKDQVHNTAENQMPSSIDKARSSLQMRPVIIEAESDGKASKRYS